MVFIFPLNDKTKQVMGDYHYGRLQAEPKNFSAIYRAIRRAIINKKHGDGNPRKFEEGKINEEATSESRSWGKK
jgi:hypothetical protein